MAGTGLLFVQLGRVSDWTIGTLSVQSLRHFGTRLHIINENGVRILHRLLRTLGSNLV